MLNAGLAPRAATAVQHLSQLVLVPVGFYNKFDQGPARSE
jgi:hypothetical protein